MKSSQSNVTERHALRATNGDSSLQSAERLGFILDQAQVGISNCSRDHRFKYVNKHYAEQHGLTPENIVGKSIVEVLGESAFNAFKPFVDEVLTGRRVEQEVEVHYERLGAKRWVHIAYEPEYNDTNVIGWVAVVKDISKRKEAQDALRAREEQLSLIYANVNDVIFYLTVEPKGKFCFESVNKAFLETTGLVEEKVVGKYVDEVIPEPSLSLVLSKYNEAIAKRQTVSWEEVTPYPTGTKTGVVNVTPVFDHQGVCTHLVGNVYDITDHRQIEQTLRYHNERFDLVRNGAQVGFWFCDLPFDELMWDNRVKEHFWLPPDARVTIDTFYERIHPDDRERTRRAIALSISNKTQYDIDYRTVSLDGNHEKWIQALGRTFYDDAGEPMRFDGVTLDITERKLAEDKLKRSEERYRAFVAQSTEAIWRFELDQPLDTSLPLEKQIDMVYETAYLAECNDAMAKMYGYENYTEIVGARLGDLMPKDNEANVAYLAAFMQNGYRIDNIESEEIDKAGNKVYFVNNLVGIIENGLVTRAWGTQRDVTAQKNYEATLRDANIRMQLAQSSTGFWTFEYHPHTNVTTMSAEAHRRYGIPIDAEDVLGVWLGNVHPDDRTRVQEQIASCLETGNTEVEYRYNHPEQGLRWIYGRAGVYNEGENRLMYGVNMDVTERKEAETELQLAHQRFLTAETALNGYVYEWDIVHNRVWRSENFTRVLGYNIGEVEATHIGFEGLVHPDDLPRIRTSFENVWKHKPSHYTDDFRVRHKSGNYIWMRDYGYLTWNEQFEPLTMVGSIVDVHKQKLLELQIHETSEKLNAMMETMPHIAFTIEPDGKPTYFNSRWTEYSGQSQADALTIRDGSYVHPDDAPVMDEWKDHLASGKPFQSETRYKRKDGAFRWHLVRVLPMHNNQNEITYWIGTCTDIHDQKEFAQRLETLVTERTEALTQSKLSLERLNAELASFAYVASHDLREPIRKVLSFGDYLVKREKEKLSERGVDYLTRMNGAAKRMDGMLDDLLAFSRVNTWDTKREVLDLNAILSQAKSTLSDKIENAHATITAAKLPAYYGVAFQFRQLFIHLLDNAIKFHQPGKAPVIDITCETIDRVSQPGLTAEHKYLHIAVSDNGLGIEPQYHERIFELFQRLHSKDKYNGTGIGLSICRKVVENHQGVISLTSEFGKGSVFNVYLPLS